MDQGKRCARRKRVPYVASNLFDENVAAGTAGIVFEMQGCVFGFRRRWRVGSANKFAAT